LRSARDVSAEALCAKFHKTLPSGARDRTWLRRESARNAGAHDGFWVVPADELDDNVTLLGAQPGTFLSRRAAGAVGHWRFDDEDAAVEDARLEGEPACGEDPFDDLKAAAPGAAAANDGERTAMRSPRRALGGRTRSCPMRVIESHIVGAPHQGRPSVCSKARAVWCKG